MNKLKPVLSAAALALVCAAPVAQVLAQGTSQGYLTDSRNTVVKSPFNLCWRTGYWSPAMATAECDPELVPRPAPVPPTPRAVPPAPPPKPAAPFAPPPAAPRAAPPKPAAKPAPKRCDATVTFQNQELFPFDTATLTAAARARLDRDVIGRLQNCATIEAVVVEGHTDRLGSQQYNQKLSEKRANAVKAYLVSKGVAAGRIETIGMGKTAPAKFCPDIKKRAELIACLAPNRRAIIFIKGPGR